MNKELIKIIKVAKSIIDKQSLSSRCAILLNFKDNQIISTNGHILLKVGFDFSMYDNYEKLESFTLHSSYTDLLIKHVESGFNIFDLLKDKKLENSENFPDYKKIAYNNQQEKISSICFTTKIIYDVCNICKKLDLDYFKIDLADNSVNKIVEKNVEILFMSTKIN